MRVVSAYRRQAPESGNHLRVSGFDWIGAMNMLRASVTRSCACETWALTDTETDFSAFDGGAARVLRFPSEERHLMLWILAVSLQYLRSSEFTEDTVFVSPDNLVIRDLRPRFAGDLSLLVRSGEKYKDRPILNAVQWWPLASREKLCAFYEQALAVARTLPDACIRWGADSESLRQLVSPIVTGLQYRAGLRVNLVEAGTALWSISGTAARHSIIAKKKIRLPDGVEIVDFKGGRKLHMADYFAASGVGQ